jgi:sugar lactone lactonase YvrE
MHMLDWVVDLPTSYGTAPTWHAGQKLLYWSDLTVGKLYSYNPVSGENLTCLDDGRPVGGITVQADGSLLLFRDQANIVIWREGEIVATVIHSIADFRQTHFSGAVADPGGRVYCATQSDQHHPGRLLCLDQTGRLNLIADSFGTPAGMGFSPDTTSFYFNDAHGTHLATWRFNYAPPTGVLSNQTPFRDGVRMNDPGAPSGLAVDADGNVWLLRWGGSAILQCDAAGALLQRIDLPVKKPTGLCFGGENFDEIFMTSAGGHRRQIDGIHAGSLARIRVPDVHGLPLHASRVQLEATETVQPVLVEAKAFTEDEVAG